MNTGRRGLLAGLMAWMASLFVVRPGPASDGGYPDVTNMPTAEVPCNVCGKEMVNKNAKPGDYRIFAPFKFKMTEQKHGFNEARFQISRDCHMLAVMYAGCDTTQGYANQQFGVYANPGESYMICWECFMKALGIKPPAR